MLHDVEKRLELTSLLDWHRVSEEQLQVHPFSDMSHIVSLSRSFLWSWSVLSNLSDLT